LTCSLVVCFASPSLGLAPLGLAPLGQRGVIAAPPAHCAGTVGPLLDVLPRQSVGESLRPSLKARYIS